MLPVYDDYAHNPQKLAAAIAGTREKHPEQTLTVVFQPHTFSRTKELRDEFITALSKADRVVLVPIYASRETDDGSISSELLVADLKEVGVDATHFYTFAAAAEAVAEQVSAQDVVLVAGAGDVTQVSDTLTK